VVCCLLLLVCHAVVMVLLCFARESVGLTHPPPTRVFRYPQQDDIQSYEPLHAKAGESLPKHTRFFLEKVLCIGILLYCAVYCGVYWCRFVTV
jgi:hypothetical protein